MTEAKKPGSPRANCINKDKINLIWKEPEDAKCKRYTYEILYYSDDANEVTTFKSRGYKCFCCINGLTSGKEYVFKVRAKTASGSYADSDPYTAKTKEYYDIVMVGKTGQGKSTLGNKLLDLDNTVEDSIRLFESVSTLSLPLTHPWKKKCFVRAHDSDVEESALSVTNRCKLLANEISNIRVLDVPGFSDSGSLEEVIGKIVSLYEGNLQIVRWVVKAHLDSQLKVRRIVYFIPGRGYLEKADGILQQELRILHYFFGKEVFDCVVLAATNSNSKKAQNMGFDKDDLQKTKHAFQLALDRLFPEDKIVCPPVVYIGFNDDPSECLSKIKDASVLKDDVLPLQFRENICSRCSGTVCYKGDQKFEVTYLDGNTTKYAESKCHPLFVPKYSTLSRVAGVVAHMMTLGLGLLVAYVKESESWPGFTNSDEICIKCENSPGSPGCSKVGDRVEHDEKEIVVDHTDTL